MVESVRQKYCSVKCSSKCSIENLHQYENIPTWAEFDPEEYKSEAIPIVSILDLQYSIGVEFIKNIKRIVDGKVQYLGSKFLVSE